MQYKKRILMSSLLISTSQFANAGDAALAITTEPREADIFIDGVLKANTTPQVLTVPEGTHQLQIKKLGYETQEMEVLLAGDAVLSKKVQLTPIVSTNILPTNKELFTPEELLTPKRSQFEETEAEFAARQKLPWSETIKRFNAAVAQHNSLYQAGTARLEDDGYDMDTQKFKLKITPQAWAKKLDLSSKGFIVIPKDQARALWQEGMEKPVFVTLDVASSSTGPVDGTWMLAMEGLDSNMKKEMLKNQYIGQVRIVKDKVIPKIQPELEFPVAIDESKEPKQFDWIDPLNQKKLLGIYERTGNTLKICVSKRNDSNERPSEFKTTDSQVTVTLYLQETVPTPELGQAFLVGIQQQWPIPQKQLVKIGTRYSDNGNGTVTDVQTNLMWKRCSEGQEWSGTTCIDEAIAITWNDAMPNKQQKTWPVFAGYSDWRMPTIDELKTLVFCRTGKPKTWNDTGESCEAPATPTIYPFAFPATPRNWFWTSSESIKKSGAAWMVDFEGGSAYESYYTSSGYLIRLVREEK